MFRLSLAASFATVSFANDPHLIDANNDKKLGDGRISFTQVSGLDRMTALIYGTYGTPNPVLSG